MSGGINITEKNKAECGIRRGAILCIIIRTIPHALPEVVTFNGDGNEERVSPADDRGISVPGRGNGKGKALRWGSTWCV